MIIALIAVAVFGLMFIALWLRRRFPQLQTLFQHEGKPRWVPFYCWFVSNIMVSIGTGLSAYYTYAHYHVFAIVRRTGSEALPTEIDIFFVVIAVALMLGFAVVFSQWGKLPPAESTTIGSKNAPAANVWPPPPRL